MLRNIDNSDYSIDKMDTSHLDDVVAIEESVFHNPWTRDMYHAEILKDYSHHYVLTKDNEVIGFFGFFNTTEDEAEVTNIAVKREYQGHGFGSVIVLSMLDIATTMGIHKIFLEVRDSNIKAISLYEKYGFKLINIRKKYYDGVEDARIYMWEGDNSSIISV